MKTKAPKSVTIFIAPSHKEHRINKNAPTGYAYRIESSDFSELHWGYGSARETQEMLAQGLYRAADQALIEEAESIVVVVQKIGFEKYLTEFVPNWRAKLEKDPSFTRNNIRVWEKLQELYLLGELKIRIAEPDESEPLEEVKVAARDAAAKSLDHCKQNPALYKKAGVFVTDEDEQK